jgi:hypothetical protein
LRNCDILRKIFPSITLTYGTLEAVHLPVAVLFAGSGNYLPAAAGNSTGSPRLDQSWKDPS